MQQPTLRIVNGALFDFVAGDAQVFGSEMAAYYLGMYACFFCLVDDHLEIGSQRRLLQQMRLVLNGVHDGIGDRHVARIPLLDDAMRLVREPADPPCRQVREHAV